MINEISELHCNDMRRDLTIYSTFSGTHLMVVGTQLMLGSLEVKGLATDASASDREIPA